MQNSIDILMLEDAATDAELAARELRKAGLSFAARRVQTEQAFITALQESPPDLILADYSLPAFTGLDALAIVREKYPDVPFILVSGTLGEEIAIQALQLGATDYVLKQRLARLAPAVTRALREAEMERERARVENALLHSEKRFRALIENSNDGIVLSGPDGTVLYASPSAARVMGSAPGEGVGTNAFTRIHPDDVPLARTTLQKLLAMPSEMRRIVLRVKTRDGSWRWVEDTIQNLLAEPSVQAIVTNFRDITESKQAEEKIHQQLNRLAALRDIDIAISGSFDLHIMLDAVIKQVISQLHVDAAAILLLDPHTHLLEHAAGRGFLTRGMERLQLRLGEASAGRAALEQTLVVVNRIPGDDSESARREWLEGENFVVRYCVPLIAKGQVKGVLDISNRSPLGPDEEWLDFLNALAGQAAIALDSAAMFDTLQRSNAELVMAYDSTIEGWSHALDLRDKETEGHAQRVTEMTLRMARAMGIDDERLVHIRRGALLHDIGKIGVPDNILLKPGPLTDEEWVLMRKHPIVAYELLAPIGYLRPSLDIPYCHHEKWDGSGYPRGLKGEQIPLSARLFAVVDVWDALRSERPYRKAWLETKVLEHIRSQRGTHFDPKAVDTFLAM